MQGRSLQAKRKKIRLYFQNKLLKFAMKRNLITIIFIILASLIFCQETNQRTIEVVGYAQIDITPDKIYYMVELGDKRLGKKFITMDFVDKQFWKLLEKHNIKRERVKISDTDSRQIRYKKRKDEVRQMKEYEIEFEDINNIDSFAKDLSKTEIIRSGIIRVDHTKLIEIEENLKIEATKNAKEKAKKILLSLNEDLGRVVEITEIGENDYRNYLERKYYNLSQHIRNRQNAYYSESPGSENLGLEFKKARLATTIKVKFEIK
jgi:hypothetical protein